MPISEETQKALDLLYEIRDHLEDNKNVEPNYFDSHVKQLENVLENPAFQRNLTVQKSLRQLKRKITQEQHAEGASSRPKFGTDLNKNEFDFDHQTGQLVFFDPPSLHNLEKRLWQQIYDGKVEEIKDAIGPEILKQAAGRNIRFLPVEIPNHFDFGWCLADTSNRTVVLRCDPDGLKPKFGTIGPGDEILAVDSNFVACSDWSNEDVLNYFQSKKQNVTLENDGDFDPRDADYWKHTVVVTVVQNFLVQSLDGNADQMVLSGDWTQVQVIEIINDGSGLGFGIVGGRSTGVVVKTVLPGGPADKDGRLRSGDHLLQISNISLHGMSSQQVAMILRQQDSGIVKLVVGRPVDSPLVQQGLHHDDDDTRDNSGAFTVATKVAIDPNALDDQLKHQQKQESDQKKPPADHQPIGSNNAEPEKQLLEQTVAEIVGESLDTVDLDHLTARTFFRENWSPKKVDMFNLVLERDPTTGLGITVAGYVHMKEEIGGLFVKSLVPGSAAERNGSINVLDLIYKVNDRCLEGLTHGESVQQLVNSGQKVHLELVRFDPKSPQSKYLEMLRKQEAETSFVDMHESNNRVPPPSHPENTSISMAKTSGIDTETSNQRSSIANHQLSDDELRSRWREVVGSHLDIIIAETAASSQEGSLGLSLEGTVDVENGTELRPHHYIQSIQPESLASKCRKLRPGDELLEVNGVKLHGENHLTVVRALSQVPLEGKTTKIVVARRILIPLAANVYMPKDQATYTTSSGQERLVKAKSEQTLVRQVAGTEDILSEVARRLRSRSLEPLTGLAVWSTTPNVIYLEKSDRGLGFSVLDYQDPLHPSENVIVVRSLVPSGVAAQDGGLVPGDRLLFVNDTDLSNATLDAAVKALKSAPKGPVRIGLAKPIPLHAEEGVQEPIISQTERLLAKGSMASPNSRRKRHSARKENGVEPFPPPLPAAPPPDWSAETRRRLFPQAYYSQSAALYGSLPHSKTGSTLSGSFLSMGSWSGGSTPSLSPAGSPSSFLRGSWASDVIQLPATMEKTIKIKKAGDPLGITVEAVDKGVNGCMVKTLLRSGAIGKDKRVHVGDYIVKINNENLRCVTSSQARAILKRTNLIGTDFSVVYIPSAEAEKYRENEKKQPHHDPILQPVNRLSPKSPYFSRKEIVPSTADSISMDTDTEGWGGPSGPASPYHSQFDVTISTQPKPIEQLDWSEGKLSRSSQPPDEYLKIFTDAETTVTTTTVSVTVATSVAEAVAQIALTCAMEDAVTYCISTRVTPLPVIVPAKVLDPFDNFLPIERLEEQQDQDELVDQKVVTPPMEEEVAPCPKEEVPLSVPVQKEIEAPSSLPDKKEEETSSTIPDQKEEEIPEPEPVQKEATPPRPASPTNEPIARKEEIVEKEKLQEKPSQASSLASTVFEDGVNKGKAPVSPKVSGSGRSKYWGEARTVEIWREAGKSLGISIVGGRVEVSQKGGLPGTGATVAGIFIKSVLATSPAGKTGQLNMGDRLLSVNKTDLKEATHEQAVEVIRNASNPVTFVVQSLHTFPSQGKSPSPGASGSASAASSAPGTPGPGGAKAPATVTISAPLVSEASPGGATSAEPLAQDTTSVMDAQPSSTKVRATETPKVSAEVTIEPVPAKTEEIQDEESGTLLPSNGAIKEAEVCEKVENDTVSPMQKSKPAVPPKPPHLILGRAMSISHDSSTGPSPEMFSPRRQSFPAKGVNGVGVYSTLRSRVDSKSAAAMDWQVDDPETEDMFGYTRKKIEMKYGEIRGELHLVEFPQMDNGLGLSLAGNRDRSKMSVFVVGIQPSSPASAGGLIRVGDELLEINGLVLYGRSHLNASAMIRSIRDPLIKLVLVRRAEAFQEMAVKPLDGIPNLSEHLQEKPVTKPEPAKLELTSIAPNSLARCVTVRKGPVGFGITLTEGTTTDNLRGVFVTNISPDSSTAQEKELKIGDQVLAVNGRPVTDWSSTKVAEAMQEAQSGEIQLTVATHPIVPVPAGPPKGQESPKVPASPAPSTGSVGISLKDEVKEPVGKRRSLTAEVPASTVRKTSSPAGSPAAPSPNLATVPIFPGQETLIEIEKGGKGLGLSIVGGSDTVLGSVVIHEVYPDGAAAKDGRLKPGDQVLEVNQESLRDVPHDSAISILRQTPSKVQVLVYRDPNLQLNLLDPTQIYNIFEVELVKKPGRGLGLSIVGRKNEPGVYVSEVVKGGVAEADGRMMAGDQILAVNGQDLTAAMQEQAAAILKTCMGKVVLKIGRWKLTEGAKGPPGGPLFPATRITTPGTPLSPGASVTTSPPPNPEVHFARPVETEAPPADQKEAEVQNILVSTPEPSLDANTIPNGHEPLATLKEENSSDLLFSVEPPATEPVPCEAAEEEPQQPLKLVEENLTEATSAAPEPPVLQQPIVNVVQATPEQSVVEKEAESDSVAEDAEIKLIPHLKEEGCDVLLTELRKIANQQLGMGIGKRSRGILVTSLQAKSVAADKLKIGDRLLAVNGNEVTDQQSAVTLVKESGETLVLQIARPKEEPQTRSLQARDVTLVRGPDGLGFSVVGGRGSPHGDLPIFVKSVYARGAAAIDSRLKRGDQILAVNGQSLIAIPHEEAVNLLKEARGEVILTILPADAKE